MLGPIASKIFFHLEGSNIGKFALVCKAWSGILKIDRLWQIKFARDFSEHSQVFETGHIGCYREIYIDLHTKGAFFTLVNETETISPENLINRTIVRDHVNVNIKGAPTDNLPLSSIFLAVSRKRLKCESRRRMFYSKINMMTIFEGVPRGYTPDDICLYSRTGFVSREFPTGQETILFLICAMLSTEEQSYPPYSINFYIKKVYKRSFIIEVISSTIE